MERTLLIVAKGLKVLKLSAIICLSILFVIFFCFSLESKLFFDQGFLHYIAFLVNEHDFVPYKDLFEFNMPIGYLFHMAIGKLFGYSATAFKVVHIIWLLAMFVLTWFIMKPMGKMTAFASCLIFGVLYLNFGSELLLERDVIGIFPIAVALLIATRFQAKLRKNTLQFLVGVLIALAALTKPHLAIGLPAFVVYININQASNKSSLRSFFKSLILGSFFALLGFVLPISITGVWLWKLAALGPLWEMLTNFAPIYSQLGLPEFSSTYTHFDFLFKTTAKSFLSINFFHTSQKGAEFLGAFLGAGVCFSLYSSILKRKNSMLLLVLAILYVISVIVAGKFWPYHWMPFKYFASLSAALIFISPRIINSQNISLKMRRNLVILQSLGCLLLLLKSFQLFRELKNEKTPPQRIRENIYYTSIEEVEVYLNKHLSSGDKVQPLDWIAGGVIHGMLKAKAVVATPYITDFQFYYNVSEPYVQKLRQHFIGELKKEIPRFIISSTIMKRGSGKNVDYDFPELKEFIEKNYILDYTGKEHLQIYKSIQ